MLLETKKLSAGYNAVPVIHDVDISVSPGEIVGLIGPNGAGKSTVLKAIFKLAQITEGEISFNGEDVTASPTHALLEKGIAFVPQGRLVFGDLSVEENLNMGGFLIDDRKLAYERKHGVFDYFPVLKEKRKERAGDLSGGQQQQLAIGRALMMKPKCLLLDEPSLGLSPKIIANVVDRLKAINKEETALLIVEQNVHIALDIADRVYVLAQGRVKAEGEGREFHDREKLKKLFFE